MFQRFSSFSILSSCALNLSSHPRLLYILKPASGPSNEVLGENGCVKHMSILPSVLILQEKHASLRLGFLGKSAHTTTTISHKDISHPKNSTRIISPITVTRFEIFRINFRKLPDTYRICVSCVTCPSWDPCPC